MTRFAPCRRRVCFRRLNRWKLKGATHKFSNSRARERALLLLFCVLLSGCRARQDVSGPSIEFIKVPLAGEGGPDKLDTIEGRVIRALPGQQIVLFARWGPWWVQPLADQPFTRIQPDSKWRNSTHFGTEYAAQLVDPGYRPQATMDVLPSKGPGVIVVAITKGRPAFWQTWWFLLGSAFACALAVATFFRLRMLQFTKQMNVRFEERLAERARIAQELHDTLLQGFLSASMQLHVADDHLAVDSPAKPSQAVIWNWWRQGMMGGAKAHYDGIVAFSQTDFTEDLKKIAVPVLVMHGDDDQIVPYADSAPLSAKLLRNSTLKTYKGFPHGMPTTEADTINADLLRFLKGAATTAAA